MTTSCDRSCCWCRRDLARQRSRAGARRRKLCARFKTCEEGLGFARGVRDAAIRDRVIKSSGDLTPELRKILDGIPIGQLSTPEVTRLGVEMFALCAKQESKSDTPGKRKASDTIYNERFKKTATRYLSQLRRAAMIERR